VSQDGGGGTSEFNNASNWNPDGVPAGEAQFTDAGHTAGSENVQNVDVNDPSGTTTIDSLVFNSPNELWRVRATGGDTLVVNDLIESRTGSTDGRFRGNLVSSGPLSMDASGGNLIFQGPSIISGDGQLTIATPASVGGRVVFARNTTLAGFSSVVVQDGARLRLIAGANAVNESFVVTGRLEGAGNRPFGSSPTSPSPARIGDLSGTGSWVFRLTADTDRDSAFFDVTNSLNLANLTIDIRNADLFADASPSNPVVEDGPVAPSWFCFVCSPFSLCPCPVWSNP
jgi:hypothetical protein